MLQISNALEKDSKKSKLLYYERSCQMEKYSCCSRFSINTKVEEMD
jgi:hypothetical protein